MSVCHLVMLSLRDDTMDVTTLLHLLDRCRKQVPGLIELHFGKNNMEMYPGKMENPAGNNYGLFSRHISAKALGDYQSHPDHEALSNFLVRLCTRPPQVVDFVNMSKI